MSTVQEFYKNINGDYEDVMLRLPNDDMVRRFIKRFVNDNTYSELLCAIEKGDIKASFEAAHKLKGIVANLAFSELYKVTSLLCDQLRNLDAQADIELVDELKSAYEEVIKQEELLDNNE